MKYTPNVRFLSEIWGVFIKTYNEETISYIIEKNENCKAIYTKEIYCFKWGKEKVKSIQIIKGYENKKGTTYLVLDPQNKE